MLTSVIIWLFELWTKVEYFFTS